MTDRRCSSSKGTKQSILTSKPQPQRKGIWLSEEITEGRATNTSIPALYYTAKPRWDRRSRLQSSSHWQLRAYTAAPKFTRFLEYSNFRFYKSPDPKNFEQIRQNLEESCNFTFSWDSSWLSSSDLKSPVDYSWKFVRPAISRISDSSWA